MSAYYMNEAMFDLPDAGFEDRTVTYLVGSAPESKDVVLLIERRPMQEDKSLRDHVVEHGRDAKAELRGYTVLSEQEREINAIPAIDIATRWREKDGSPVYTRRIHLTLGSTWMILAAEGPAQRRAFCDEQLDHVVGSMKLRA